MAVCASTAFVRLGRDFVCLPLLRGGRGCEQRHGDIVAFLHLEISRSYRRCMRSSVSFPPFPAATITPLLTSIYGAEAESVSVCTLSNNVPRLCQIRTVLAKTRQTRKVDALPNTAPTSCRMILNWTNLVSCFGRQDLDDWTTGRDWHE